jgi:hypothetical protein
MTLQSVLHGGNTVARFVGSTITVQSHVKQRFAISWQNYVLQDGCWTKKKSLTYMYRLKRKFTIPVPYYKQEGRSHYVLWPFRVGWLKYSVSWYKTTDVMALQNEVHNLLPPDWGARSRCCTLFQESLFHGARTF